MMGMRECPGSGYVVLLSRLVELLHKPDRDEVEKLLETYSGEEICELLNDALPIELPRPEEVFRFSDEDSCPDMDKGEWYVRFAENDLYARAEKPELKELHRLGIAPKLAHWSIWG
jgi:hypothetical protein